MSNARYERRQLLGDGGMGQVWLGVDNELGRAVALKVPLQRLGNDPKFVDRFRREARAMARIKHDNVIDIYDVCDSDHGPFIVMEYVPGGSLAGLLSRRPQLKPATTMRIVTQAARALEAAHRQAIIHRDVKPANLLLRHAEDRGRISVLLTDFGIAHTPTSDALTDPGQNMGTVSYMAPELFDGGAASVRSDVYSLGIVAYECLAGRPPFRADSAVAVATMHLTKTPDPLPEHIPLPVRRVVERAIAKRPEQRFASAREMAEAAEAAGAPAPAAGGPARPAPSPPDPRRVAGRVTPPPPKTRVDPAADPGGRPRPADPRPIGRAGRTGRAGRAGRVWAAVAALAVAVAASLAIYAKWGGTSTDDSPMPADLRAFAPNWPFATCTKDDPPGENQDERWRCPLDAQTTLYLIRYQAGYRDAKRSQNDRMPTTARGVELRRGTATSPAGTTGYYREYEVDVGTKDSPDWNDEIWFDNYPATSPEFALLLRTKRSPDTRQALDRIRGQWNHAKYSQPA